MGGVGAGALGEAGLAAQAGHVGQVRRWPAWTRALAWAGAAALLFLAYWRVSWTVPATSDGAAQALQARDMLAGNWLLHGWTLSDVSFYTTELPEYVLVELVRPFGLGVIHLAAAVTYTLLVLAVFALARGRARGREGWLRGGIAAVIVLAPQPGYGAFVLLLSPDHVGTQLPLLLGWLLVDHVADRDAGRAGGRGADHAGRAGHAGRNAGHADRAGRAGRAGRNAGRAGQAGQAAERGRRLRAAALAPAALCPLLAWVQFADRIALLTAVLPLLLVCGVRAGRAGTAVRWRRPARTARLEVALAVAAVGSVGLAWAASRAIEAAGGFAGHPLPFTLAPLGLLWTHTWLTGWGLLELFGANFLGVTGVAGTGFAVVHLTGLAAAAAATAVTLARFARPGRSLARFARPGRAGRAEQAGNAGPAGEAGRAGQAGPAGQGGLVDAVLAVAVVVNLVSYAVSIEPGTVLGTGYDAREIAAVLPLGAVLAGRVFGPLLAARLRRPAAGRGGAKATVRSESLVAPLTGAAALGGATALLYAAALGYAAARPAADGRYAELARWLTAHGLRYGLGGASANVLTADSGGRATVAATAVRGGRVRPLLYQSAEDAYDPAAHDARFAVMTAPADGPGYAAEVIPAPVARATFGEPARVYGFDGFTVAVWDVNLLTKLRQ